MTDGGEQRADAFRECRDRGEHAFGGGLVEGVVAMESPRGIAERQRLAAQGRALGVRPAAVLLRPHEQRAHVGDGRLQLAHPDVVHPGFLQRGEGFAKERPDADHAVAGSPHDDPRDPGHGDRAREATTVTRLRSLLTAYLREARGGVGPERAFEMAIDLDASELEDVVVDMMKVVKSPEWRERAIQLLLHDLGDLSYMVERHTRNEALLARADALIERRVGGLGRRRVAARGGRA